MSRYDAIRARCERAKINPVGNAYATHDEYEREITELLDEVERLTERGKNLETVIQQMLTYERKPEEEQ